jgi:N-carbamoylputrescine amidase
MSRVVKVAATQFACTPEKAANVDKAESLVRAAARQGAKLILLQELFEGLYFCHEQDPNYFEWSHNVQSSPFLTRMKALAKELEVVLPICFFERANNAHFNSCLVIDCDGESLGLYRKSHIPDGPGYQEKFYFSPGDTGFKVFSSRAGIKIGLGICWDQWFPECARSLALQGAEVILYPTAIGSEPQDPCVNSYPHWIRTMTGHSAANLLPIVCSNRIGREEGLNGSHINFYGGSFITGAKGEILSQVGVDEEELRGLQGAFHPQPKPVEGIALATLDLDAIRLQRLGWGVFRDRRPDLYGAQMTLDGRAQD